jgi:hypothetical protein
LRTPEVRGCKECIDFGLLQVGDRLLSAFLEGYGTDLSAPSEMLRAMQGHKTGQRVDGRQALVPGRNRALSAVLKINKEPSHGVRRDMDNIQTIDALASLTSDERDE